MKRKEGRKGDASHFLHVLTGISALPPDPRIVPSGQVIYIIEIDNATTERDLNDFINANAKIVDILTGVFSGRQAHLGACVFAVKVAQRVWERSAGGMPRSQCRAVAARPGRYLAFPLLMAAHMPLCLPHPWPERRLRGASTRLFVSDHAPVCTCMNT